MASSGELERRIVHSTGTAVPAAYLLGVLTWGQTRIVLGIAVAVGLILEGLRLTVGLDWRIFDQLTRGYESSNLAGYALYLLGAAAAAFVFEPSVAVPAILMLTIADPISGLLGSDELKPVKSPHVLAITFGICLGLAIPFVPVEAAAAGAAAATVADGVKPVIAGYVIDDNVTIPIGAAVVMFLVVENPTLVF